MKVNDRIYNEYSKRRKTSHISDDLKFINPSLNFDLSEKEDFDLEKVLESRSPNFNFNVNSYKKRKFDNLDSDIICMSKIPKPMRGVSIFYSKYSDHPTAIPKI